MLIHIIADFGYADLAFAEVVQRFKMLLPEAELMLSSVPAFATLAAGFCVAQLALNEHPDNMMIFHNVAPRRDDTNKRKNNDGERLATMTCNGVRIVGVNAGYAFSYLKNEATLYAIDTASAGSQFRSRDIFPQAFAKLVTGDSILAAPILKETIADVPDSSIAYIDGFGNIKTTLPAGCYLPGQELEVVINEHRATAIVSDGSFSVAQGQLTLSVGSSGWRCCSGQQLRFMELFLRGGSAAALFGWPSCETPIAFHGAAESRQAELGQPS